MSETENLRAELALVDELLRAEMSHLQELEEKRRLIGDGVAELRAPSELWEQYVEEVDRQIDVAGTRLEHLQRLRDEINVQIEPRQ